MKILFACHRLPYPPKRGGKIRPFNIIRHLSESGHRVTVASLARSDEEYEEGQGLRDYCDEVLVGKIGSVNAMAQMIVRLPTPTPSSMGYFFSRQLHRLTRDAVAGESFDLAFVHCSSAAQYVSAATGVRSIIDFGDMDSRKWLDYSTFKPFPLSVGYRLEAGKLDRAERMLASRFDVSTCTTRAELETLNGLGAARRSDWFPNGVDSDFFCPGEAPYDPDSISFIGRMDYFPNQQAMQYFCDDILPIVRERRPATRLTIIGANPSRGIRKLGERPGITVTGTVPDVRDYVRNTALTVAPLIIARGTQNKILESMSMSVPVVSSHVAARGVDAEPGKHLLTAGTPAEFAASILRLLHDRGERVALANAARQRVLDNHSWPASMQKLDRILTAAVQSP